jgi:hypothetical protein
LRDYFAAKAMQTLLEMNYELYCTGGRLGAHSYELADEMLKARLP